MKLLLTAVIFLAFITSGCFFTDERVRGNGVIKTKRVDVSKFDHISVGSAIHVYVKQDSFYSAIIQADENLLEYIDIDATYRYDLNINEADGYRLKPSRPIKVFVTSPMIKTLEASGASEIFSENVLDREEALHMEASGASSIKLDVKAANIDAEASGASTITLRGDAKNIKINVAGASTIKGFGLLTESATADASGASNAELFVSTTLKADASGASTISYKGNASVTKNVSGAANVKKVD